MIWALNLRPDVAQGVCVSVRSRRRVPTTLQTCRSGWYLVQGFVGRVSFLRAWLWLLAVELI